MPRALDDGERWKASSLSHSQIPRRLKEEPSGIAKKGREAALLLPGLASGIFAVKMQERGKSRGQEGAKWWSAVESADSQAGKGRSEGQVPVPRIADRPKRTAPLEEPQWFWRAGTTWYLDFFLAMPPTRGTLRSPVQAAALSVLPNLAHVWSRSSSFSQGSCISRPILASSTSLPLPLSHSACCDIPPPTRVHYPAIQSPETSHLGKLPLA
jgi:hypothetical protein